MIKKIALIFIIVLAVNNCTPDDICSDGTPTTPLLIIKFMDITNQTERKAVPNLLITDRDDPSIIVLFEAVTDSIAIPLRNFSTSTQFIFTKDNIESDLSDPNPDMFSVSYTLEDVYINRACGFKTTYQNISPVIENEGLENWMLSFEILQTNIENINETHISIFH